MEKIPINKVINMNERQTRKFVALWNKKNGYDLGENTIEGNMRYVCPGVVTWNVYDAPDLDILQIVTIYKSL